MSVFDGIQIIDDLLPTTTIAQLIKFANNQTYNVGVVIGDHNPETVKKVRDAETCRLSPQSPSLTNSHWANLMEYTFKRGFEQYQKKFPLVGYEQFVDIAILKYEDKGFYDYHVDHHATIPRTLSCVILLNNDYVGGELCFFDDINKEEFCVQPRPGRMIMWPSNFLFPHKVKPVTKGKRFSVIIWAL